MSTKDQGFAIPICKHGQEARNCNHCKMEVFKEKEMRPHPTLQTIGVIALIILAYYLAKN